MPPPPPRTPPKPSEGIRNTIESFKSLRKTVNPNQAPLPAVPPGARFRFYFREPAAWAKPFEIACRSGVPTGLGVGGGVGGVVQGRGEAAQRGYCRTACLSVTVTMLRSTSKSTKKCVSAASFDSVFGHALNAFANKLVKHQSVHCQIRSCWSLQIVPRQVQILGRAGLTSETS